jgi:type III restriction enzyme
MSDEKKNIENLTENDGQQAFLLMKQAISTGWDCPRAKVLVKLREGGSEDFQIQTIGRIRRMPERRHYGLDILDYCYIYTLDTQYKMGLLSQLDKAYQVRRLFIRDEAKDFELTKELRNLDFDGLGERETLIKVHEYFKQKYNLGKNQRINQENLAAGGYNFEHEIDSKILQGIFRTAEDLANGVGKNNVNVKTTVNTHSHGIYLLHSVDGIKKATGMQAQKVKNILRRMFSRGKKSKYKFISLENSDFYAFVINNAKKLKIDFNTVTTQMGGEQLSFSLTAKTANFHIPEMELYKYCEVKKPTRLIMNAYKDYTNEFITDKTRSKSERLFERYCEQKKEKIEWVYKNGDTGQQYFSIVYLDALLKQWLFYPDYIVKTKDGEVWIIETKGGEVRGHSKNIDVQVGNKFRAFKRYAGAHKLKWGFVRDIDEELFINNTEYVEDMSDPSWRPLSDEL